MRRVALIIVIAALLGHLLGVLISADPGYVLLSYRGHSLSMSLWVFLLLLVGSMLLVTLIYRSIRSTFGLKKRVGTWLQSRTREKGLIHTNRGLLYLQQGDLDRASRFLDNGLRADQLSAVNYIALARIADL